MSVHYSSRTDEWSTPPEIFALAQKFWGTFNMDVAAQEYNTKCDIWSNDSLEIEWAKNNWCNPPFSLIDDFIDKAILEKNKNKNTVMICKAAVETGWFEQIKTHASSIVFLSPRVHYIGAGKSCPFPSCFARFSLDPAPLTQCKWYNYKTDRYY